MLKEGNTKTNVADNNKEELDADPELDAEMDIDLLHIKGEGKVSDPVYDQEIEKLKYEKSEEDKDK